MRLKIIESKMAELIKVTQREKPLVNLLTEACLTACTYL